MPKLISDLMNPAIAPTPAREARAAIVGVVIMTALIIWWADDLALQIILPTSVAAFYGIRIAIAVARQKRRLENQPTRD